MSSETVIDLPLTGWALLHSDLPASALKAIDRSVYGREGLTDIEEAELIRRLHVSGLLEEFGKPEFTHLGMGSQTFHRGTEKERKVTTWIFACDWSINVGGIWFYGRGAHEDEDPDNAMKGAQTGAMKTLAKYLSMDYSVRVDGTMPTPSRNNTPRPGNEGKEPARGIPKRPGDPVLVEGTRCPSCGKGTIRLKDFDPDNLWLGCSAYKEGCKTTQSVDLSPAGEVPVDPDEIPF